MTQWIQVAQRGQEFVTTEPATLLRYGDGVQWVETTVPAGTHMAGKELFGGRDPCPEVGDEFKHVWKRAEAEAAIEHGGLAREDTLAALDGNSQWRTVAEGRNAVFDPVAHGLPLPVRCRVVTNGVAGSEFDVGGPLTLDNGQAPGGTWDGVRTISLDAWLQKEGVAPPPIDEPPAPQPSPAPPAPAPAPVPMPAPADPPADGPAPPATSWKPVTPEQSLAMLAFWNYTNGKAIVGALEEIRDELRRLINATPKV
jgi:hypothetical protein